MTLFIVDLAVATAGRVSVDAKCSAICCAQEGNSTIQNGIPLEDLLSNRKVF